MVTPVGGTLLDGGSGRLGRGPQCGGGGNDVGMARRPSPQHRLQQPARQPRPASEDEHRMGRKLRLKASGGSQHAGTHLACASHVA